MSNQPKIKIVFFKFYLKNYAKYIKELCNSYFDMKNC